MTQSRVKNTSNISQLMVIYLDIALSFLVYFLLEGLISAKFPDIRFGIYYPIKSACLMNLYFIATVPFFSGRTLGMLLANKSVANRSGHTATFAISLFRGCIYYAILWISAFTIALNLVSDRKMPFDVLFGYRMRNTS